MELEYGLYENEEIAFYRQKLKEAKTKLVADNAANRANKKKMVLNQIVNDKCALYHGDSIEVIKGIPNNSLHYSIFSPPFASLFTYSDSKRDLGNSLDIEFYEHFLYLVEELYRVMMPGRLISIHCMDIPAMKSRDGFIGLKDFPGMILRCFESVGFIYHSKVQIKKNELFEAQRTKAIGLAHKQVIKDSSICRQALPDYIMTIRKPGENPEPIARKNGFEEYIGGDKKPTEKNHKEHAKNKFSQKIWQKYASSVWLDIRQTNTLNTKVAKQGEDERHICPMQLDSIARCLELWSNKDDVVFDPFCGIGSTGYQALEMGRRFVGVELKKSYWETAVKNLNISANRKSRLQNFFTK